MRVRAASSVDLQDLSGFSRNGIFVTAPANVGGRRLVVAAPGASWVSRQSGSGSTLSLLGSILNARQGHRINAGNTLLLNNVDLTMQNNRGLRAEGGAVTVGGSGNTATGVSPLCNTSGGGVFTGSFQFVSVNGAGAGSCP